MKSRLSFLLPVEVLKYFNGSFLGPQHQPREWPKWKQQVRI